MKTAAIIFLLLFCKPCTAQHLPVSAFTYDSCAAIDNYFGETDSLLLKHNIQSVKVFLRKDTMRLIQSETYKNGRKIRREEYHVSGKAERTIIYTYPPNVVAAELIHYPSPDNYNIYPSRRFVYLDDYEAGDSDLIFPRDSASGRVRMFIKHTWQKTGTIRFEAFDKNRKKVASHTMRPLLTWQEYQEQATKTNANMKIVSEDGEEYTYNEKGKLAHYKSAKSKREDQYYYDNRGLLTRIERLLLGKPETTLIYIYK